ncbi:YoaK family protein [Terriglobus sp.]|uniref:YoaK family protein n=1 Tax=Terriglobus sp. TaxID=1889013 RepID=UPI003B0014E0
MPSASLLAFTGASLDSFLYLNHGHVFAGVMTGNAVLCGVGIFNKSSGGALHYAWPILAYVCGIFLVAIVQRRVRHHPVRLALGIVILGILTMSFAPDTFPERWYVFVVVLLTGFLVGISQKVDSYAYNATVLTGTLRDGALSLYGALDPRLRGGDLSKVRDLWTLMLSFFAGAVCGGLLGRHIGNRALWLPVATLCLVLALVLRAGSNTTGFDYGGQSREP